MAKHSSSFSVYSVTRQSPYHRHNEDSHHIGEDFVVIADGMGGETCGDVASGIAVESIRSVMARSQRTELSDNQAKELMFQAIQLADQKIRDYIAEHPGCAGMGTTVLMALYGADRLYLAWCGDSHCFRYANGSIGSLTKDHSFVQDLIDGRIITVEESFTHPDSNLITRFVGGGKDSCQPDFVAHGIAGDEMFILCSDGLSGYCMPEQIRQCVMSNTRRHSLPSELLALALRRGSQDDITIVTIMPGRVHGFRWRTLFDRLMNRISHGGFMKNA